MDYRSYRFADLFFFGVIATFSQVISEFGYFALPKTEFYVSLALLVSIIAYIRWGLLGVLVYMASQIPLVYMTQGEATLWFKWFFYVISAGALIGLEGLHTVLHRHRAHKNLFIALFYVLIAFSLMAISRGVVLFIEVSDNLGVLIVEIFASQLLSMVISMIVMVIVIKVSPSLVVDMKTYLKQAQEEQNNDELND